MKHTVAMKTSTITAPGGCTIYTTQKGALQPWKISMDFFFVLTFEFVGVIVTNICCELLQKRFLPSFIR